MRTKRVFDFVVSFLSICFLLPFFLFSYLLISIDTQSNGIFVQTRVGQYGKLFTILKFKTIHPRTRAISSIGAFFRRYKIDELPQLFNVLMGQMAIVGPRPDIVGYYDVLVGEERKILELKPGITSLAALKYKQEEQILLQQNDALGYNDEVIFPDKVKMNLDYYYHQSLKTDIQVIAKTFQQIFSKNNNLPAQVS